MATASAHNLALPPKPIPARPRSFMTLPTEIRLKVYKSVFELITISEYLHSSNGQSTYKLSPTQPLALLLICRKVYSEAQQLAKRCPIGFVARGDFDIQAICLPRPVLQWFTSVTLSQTGRELPQCLEPFTRDLFPRLKRIELRAPLPGRSFQHVRMSFKIAVEMLGSGTPGPATSETVKRRLKHRYAKASFDEIKQFVKSSNLTVITECDILINPREANVSTTIMDSTFPGWKPVGMFRVVGHAVMVRTPSDIELVEFSRMPPM
ncbi:hypothetical protein H2200_003083 [Cladophialophora chaetospira]|uniref:Uncharacterized protein n=1 Tax=Cladophialophora chaetospira TaxID=386627 RepID=A0AA38XGS1_9EURO|nr:hypothetical protein H2200_003083 [Cladophialophora chaetospira]